MGVPHCDIGHLVEVCLAMDSLPFNMPYSLLNRKPAFPPIHACNRCDSQFDALSVCQFIYLFWLA
jgi:hypothetical protein